MLRCCRYSFEALPVNVDAMQRDILSAAGSDLLDQWMLVGKAVSNETGATLTFRNEPAEYGQWNGQMTPKDPHLHQQHRQLLGSAIGTQFIEVDTVRIDDAYLPISHHSLTLQHERIWLHHNHLFCSRLIPLQLH